jgi:hypothetical protein
VGVIYIARVADGLSPPVVLRANRGAVERFYREVGIGSIIADFPGVESAPEQEAQAHRESEPLWIAYIEVEDADAAADRARKLGGHVLLPPTEVPGLGRAAVLQDPRGRAFGIFTPSTDSRL